MKLMIVKNKILTLFLATIVVCLSFEVLLRIFLPHQITPAHTVPAFGIPNAWKKNISFRENNMFAEYSQITINNNRFRGLKNFTYKKPNNTLRIMGFGPSFMMGSFVNDNETFTYFLEGVLNDKIKRYEFEVLNVGKPGWDILNHYIYLRNEGYKYSPDLMIIFRRNIEFHYLDLMKIRFSKMNYKRTSGNNVTVSLEGFNSRIQENYFIENVIRQLDRLPFYYEFTKYSQVWTRLRMKMSSLWSIGFLNKSLSSDSVNEFIKSIGLKDTDNIIWEIEGEAYRPDFKSASLHLSQITGESKHLAEISLILYQWVLTQLVSLGENVDSKVMVVETPHENQVLELLPIAKSKLNLFSNKQAYFHSLLPEFISFQRKNSIMLLFPSDVHFTPAGNHLASISSYNFLLKNKLFPQLDSKQTLNSLEVAKSIQKSNRLIQESIDSTGYSFYLEGLGGLKRGLLPEAKNNLIRYVEITDDTQAKFQLCVIYFKEGKYHEARDCFEFLPKGFVLEQLKYLYLSNIYITINDPDRALSLLEEWESNFKLDVTFNSNFYYLRAKAFWLSNEKGLAEVNYRLGARKFPDDYVFPAELGIFYFEQKKYLKAIEEFRRASSLNLDDYTSYLFSSIANFKVGNTIEGNRLIRKFIWTCKSSCERAFRRNDWL
jgi:hypothetical protein